MGVNSFGRLREPTYLVTLAPRQQVVGDRCRHVGESLTLLGLGLHHSNASRFRPYGGTDLTDRGTLPHTRNSPYIAFCLALRRSARRVGLIRVGFTNHHSFSAAGQYPLTRSLQPLTDVLRSPTDFGLYSMSVHNE
jgi:hypothetical protein